MIANDKVIVIDLDGTICHEKGEDEEYDDVLINNGILEKLRDYREKGFYIIVYSARNMRTYAGNMRTYGILSIILEKCQAYGRYRQRKPTDTKPRSPKPYCNAS